MDKKELKKQVEMLAEKGYSITIICEATGVSRSSMYTEPYKDILDTIKKARTVAKMQVIDTLMKRSDEDTTALIYLSKSLKVFEDYYPTETPKNIIDALSKIKDIYKSVASNELDTSKADKLIHYLDVYIKAYDAKELERRLEILEEAHND